MVKEAFIGEKNANQSSLPCLTIRFIPGEPSVLLILHSSTKLILRCEHSSFKSLILALHEVYSAVKVSCLEMAASKLTVQ